MSVTLGFEPYNFWNAVYNLNKETSRQNRSYRLASYLCEFLVFSISQHYRPVNS